MIEVSILDGIAQSFFIYFGIIVVYNFIFGNTGVKNIVYSLILLLILSLIGIFLGDITSFFLALGMIIRERRKPKINYYHLNVFLMLLSSQIVVLALAAYFSRGLLYLFLDLHQIADLSTHSHLFTGVEIVTMCIIDLLALQFGHVMIKRYAGSLDISNDGEVNKHLFTILLAVFGSIELLLLISNFQGVTATIQLTLLLTFVLMLGLISWQALETTRVYILQKKVATEKLQNEQLDNYLKSVEHQYLELRKFKHDYKNLIASLNAQNDIGEIKDYLTDYTNSKAFKITLNDGSIARIQHLKNDTLRGLIVQKFFYAKQCDVKLNIEIGDTDFYLSHGVATAMRIVGNLLDNAIEQAILMADRAVTVAFNVIENTSEISISNSVGSDFNQHKIFETGYSTKGSNRGLGLANVQELVEQQHGFYMEIESTKGYVTMSLIITEDN